MLNSTRVTLHWEIMLAKVKNWPYKFRQPGINMLGDTFEFHRGNTLI